MSTAYLSLEDGTVLKGESFGYTADVSGEVVFTTAMTGYPQSLTDPSFAGQILVFTYPLMGNFGVPIPQHSQWELMTNLESTRIWTKGVVVSSSSQQPSHHESRQDLGKWLSKQKVPAISGIDTRMLTMKLRTHGVMKGRISHSTRGDLDDIDLSSVVSDVSVKKRHVYAPQKANGKQIVLIDCGVKHGIIRKLLARGYRVIRIPWNDSAEDLTDIDAVICSNGPGDPKDCKETVSNIQNILKRNIPFFGICLGHQLLALAVGADTYKLPYGHRGVNQPCIDVTTQKAYLTSQNHGYAVDEKSIPDGFSEWFRNLNDHTNEGIKHKKRPISSVQFHPEGQPGPFDSHWLFDLI